MGGIGGRSPSDVDAMFAHYPSRSRARMVTEGLSCLRALLAISRSKTSDAGLVGELVAVLVPLQLILRSENLLHPSRPPANPVPMRFGAWETGIKNCSALLHQLQGGFLHV